MTNEEIIRRFNNEENKIKVVDMGTGTGEFLSAYREKYPEHEIIGFELLSIPQILLKAPGVVTGTDARETGIRGDSVDKVTINMLPAGFFKKQPGYKEPLIAGFLSEAMRILKPGGQIYIVTENRQQNPVSIRAVKKRLRDLGFDIELGGVPFTKEIESDYPRVGIATVWGPLIIFKASKSRMMSVKEQAEQDLVNLNQFFPEKLKDITDLRQARNLIEEFLTDGKEFSSERVSVMKIEGDSTFVVGGLNRALVDYFILPYMSVAGVFEFPDRKIALPIRSPFKKQGGQPTLPGGYRQSGMTPEENILREMSEELGFPADYKLDAKHLRLIKIVSSNLVPNAPPEVAFFYRYLATEAEERLILRKIETDNDEKKQIEKRKYYDGLESLSKRGPGQGETSGLVIISEASLKVGRVTITNKFLDQREEYEAEFAVPLKLFTQLDDLKGLRFDRQDSAQSAQDQEMKAGEPKEYRIMLIEHEPSVAAKYKKVLEVLGYQVEVFDKMGDALVEFQKRPRAYSLVISNFNPGPSEPNMNGIKLARQLSRIDSKIKIGPKIKIVIHTLDNKKLKAKIRKENLGKLPPYIIDIIPALIEREGTHNLVELMRRVEKKGHFRKAVDSAMKARDVGGIDLTPANMHLQTKMDSRLYVNGDGFFAGRGVDSALGRDDKGIQFHIDPAMLAQLQNAPGFVPLIISIHSMTDLRKFLNSP